MLVMFQIAIIAIKITVILKPKRSIIFFTKWDRYDRPLDRSRICRHPGRPQCWCQTMRVTPLLRANRLFRERSTSASWVERNQCPCLFPCWSRTHRKSACVTEQSARPMPRQRLQRKVGTMKKRRRLPAGYLRGGSPFGNFAVVSRRGVGSRRGGKSGGCRADIKFI